MIQKSNILTFCGQVMSGSFEDILGLFGVDEPGDISDA